jgi:hypothetical protein
MQLQTKLKKGRLHSLTDQSPVEMLPEGCKEEGIASYIYWDAWAQKELPVADIRHEMEQLQLDPKGGGDTVVVWAGSNFIDAARRMSSLLDVIDKLHGLGVKMVWDSPTFQDTAIMAATSTKNSGIDKHTKIPITYNAMQQRKAKGELGSNQYKTEKLLFDSGLEIPMTRRWQLTNRYRGLQCDGMHTDMRGRDPLFYNTPCPQGEGPYGATTACNWVEPFKSELEPMCPMASGIDDLVLQSGLYALCASRERPFCYQHTEYIR